MKIKKVSIFSFFLLIISYLIINYHDLFQVHHVLLHHKQLSEAIKNQILKGTSKNIFSINLNQVKTNLSVMLKDNQNYDIIKEYPDSLNIFTKEQESLILIELIDSETKGKIKRFELIEFEKLYQIQLNKKLKHHLIIQFYEYNKNPSKLWKKMIPILNKILESTFHWNYLFFKKIKKISFYPSSQKNFIELKNYPILFYFENHLSFQTFVHIFIIYHFLDLNSAKFTKIYIDKYYQIVAK